MGRRKLQQAPTRFQCKGCKFYASTEVGLNHHERQCMRYNSYLWTMNDMCRGLKRRRLELGGAGLLETLEASLEPTIVRILTLRSIFINKSTAG